MLHQVTLRVIAVIELFWILTLVLKHSMPSTKPIQQAKFWSVCFEHKAANPFASSPLSYFFAVKPQAFFRAIFFEWRKRPKFLGYRANFFFFSFLFFFAKVWNFA